MVDTRLELGFNAAHVPRALSIWQEGLSGLAGWYLPYMLLVMKSNDPMTAAKPLLRITITGYLAGGMQAWHKAGLESNSIDVVTVQNLCRRLDERADSWILMWAVRMRALRRGWLKLGKGFNAKRET